MALRDFWGFDHLPISNAVGADRPKGNGLAYNGYGLSVAPDNTVAGARSSTIESGGWIVFDSNDADTTFKWRIRWTAGTKTDGVSDKSHFGFTYKRTNPFQGRAEFPAGTPLLWLGSTPLLTHADFPTTLDRVFKFEVTINRLTKTVGVYVDGQLKKLLKTPGLADSYSGSTQVYFGHPLSLIYTGLMSFRDFYFVDDTKDDSICNRLSTYSVALMPLKTAVAPAWTTTAATPLASLTASMTVNAATPILASGITPTDLECTVTAAGAAGSRLRAVSLLASISKNAGTAVTMKSAIKTAVGDSVPDPIPVTTNSLTYSKVVTLQVKAPDGSALTDALINASRFVLTPS